MNPNHFRNIIYDAIKNVINKDKPKKIKVEDDFIYCSDTNKLFYYGNSEYVKSVS